MHWVFPTEMISHFVSFNSLKSSSNSISQLSDVEIKSKITNSNSIEKCIIMLNLNFDKNIIIETQIASKNLIMLGKCKNSTLKTAIN